MMTTIPVLGSTVLYRLSPDDCAKITQRRGAGLFEGNPVSPGMQFPAKIVRCFDDTSPGTAVNLQVFLDGDDSLWVTSAHEGEGPREWSAGQP